MKNSDGIITFFDEVLNEKKCLELAKKHRFIQRASSLLKGHEFIKMMIIPSEGLSMDSLKGLCNRMKEFNSDAHISSQALSERINHISAKELMKGVYAAIRSHMHAKVQNFSEFTSLEKFNSILIEDSTVIKLNEKLQVEFQGTNRGGTGAKSQVKIDLIYDLRRSQITNAELFKGRESDQGLANRILKFIKAGDLVIRDLGYFVLKVFEKINDSGAFYISRLLSNVKIFMNKDDAKPIDLGKYLKMNFPNQSIIDIEQVFLGDEKVPARLVLYRLPKDVKEARLREANKRAKATGRTMSKGKKLLLSFAAFVTNVSKDVISAEVLGTIYRLRWEVELIFKRWKSQLKIDFLKGINKNRIECLIWSRLCTILIIELISGFVSEYVERMLNDHEISHAKLISYILRQSRFALAIAMNKLEDFLKGIENDARRMLLKDKRKRTTMRERVQNFESYYEMQPSNFQQFA
jgi:hypothetical protein